MLGTGDIVTGTDIFLVRSIFPKAFFILFFEVGGSWLIHIMEDSLRACVINSLSGTLLIEGKREEVRLGIVGGVGSCDTGVGGAGVGAEVDKLDGGLRSVGEGMFRR